MAITLGSVSLDEANTAVREDLEEVGGRNERRIRLTGSIVGENSVAAIHDRLDGILDAASVEDFSAELSLRAGRRMFVRRDKFRREVLGESPDEAVLQDIIPGAKGVLWSREANIPQPEVIEIISSSPAIQTVIQIHNEAPGRGSLRVL